MQRAGAEICAAISKPLLPFTGGWGGNWAAKMLFSNNCATKKRRRAGYGLTALCGGSIVLPQRRHMQIYRYLCIYRYICKYRNTFTPLEWVSEKIFQPERNGRGDFIFSRLQ